MRRTQHGSTSQGSFGAILEFRWHETQELIVPLLVGVAQKTFGMMLLGVAVWRAGVIREPQRYRSLLWAIALGAGIVGIANTTADVLWEAFRKAVHVMPAFAVLGSHVPLACAYASGLLLWRRSARAEALDGAGCRRGADGAYQLPDAVAGSCSPVLRLWVGTVRPARPYDGSAHRWSLLRRATLVQQMVAEPIPLRTVRVGLAVVDLWPQAADASCSNRIHRTESAFPDGWR